MEPGIVHSSEVIRPFMITMVSTLDRKHRVELWLIVLQTLGYITGNFIEQQTKHSQYQD